MSDTPPLEPWNHLEGREKLPRVKKVSYTHDAMIDLIIGNPTISQNELAVIFGYTPGWVSLVMSSDAFRARLESRKADLVDPTILMSLEEKFKALAEKSLEVLRKKLENPNVSDNLAISAANLAAKSLGLGQPKSVTPERPADDRLDRLGGRLLALMGDKVIQANRSLDYEIIDAKAREIGPCEGVPAEGSLRSQSTASAGTAEAARE
jgi:hypothetical protein